MLTHLAATVPPRIGHLIARLLGISAALREFCPCGTCGSAAVSLADWEKELICDRCGASCCGCRAGEIR